jgi:anti-anti-sigma factor
MRGGAEKRGGPVRTTVEHSVETGVVAIRFDGELSPATVSTVRTALGKAAAECPAAVVVDLSGLEQADRSSLGVFATATCRAEADWGVPILLCAPTPAVCRNLGGYRGFLSLYNDQTLALPTVRACVSRWLWERLTPTPGSAAAARALAGEACLRWNLRHLREPARLIASELASNAIMHAGTNFDVTAAFTGRYLRIAVQDRSTAMPRSIARVASDGSGTELAPGWGLRAVEAASSRWGATRLPTGKIVWSLVAALN